LEEYWSGKIGATNLLEAGKQLRLTHRQLQQDAGIDIIPSNDFSFYDQVLDSSCMVGAIPSRFSQLDDLNGLDQYFAMARGIQQSDLEIPALEMTK
jgi:5-methyltetrahydropteroyltriglutamate--homocysteine methyltransferase